MKTIKYGKWLLSLALSALAIGQALAQARTTYLVTDAGLGWSPWGISATGMMAGQASNLSYAWSRAAGPMPTRIPGLAYNYGYGVMAYNVSAGGIVVGTDTDAGEAFVWDPVNGTRQVADFDGSASDAYGINANGHIVGRYWPGAEPIPYLWKPELGWAPFPLSGVTGTAESVNINDQIACNVYYQGQDVAAIWEPDGTVRFLGNWLTQTENAVYDINDLGYVCGYTFGSHVYDPQGNYTPIYNPLNHAYSTVACCINNQNVVVGSAGTGSGASGFIWSAKAGFTFLNAVLAPRDATWNVDWAGSINDSGQIAGTAYLNGVRHAVLLTPITSTGVGR